MTAVRIAFSLLLGTAPAVFADDALRQALTFHAGFDGGTDAGFALGDKQIYSAASYKAQDEAVAGLGGTDVVRVPGQGRYGDALKFPTKNTKAVFYKAPRNVAFDARNWSGTLSFWLKLDPDKDLAPGYCDPIQVTDKAYNDSAIWVDYSKDDVPRHFRLGVFGALKSWNPDNLQGEENPAFSGRLVKVTRPPFRADRWTHVAIVYHQLGSGDGRARLYLDGALAGEARGIREPFAWDLPRAAIRLGLSYTGLFDELAVFRRPLTDEEIGRLRALPGGAASLYK
ncbi:MAG: LamG domain-containing protein [Bryobacterales bacterium]|nr:LamG domain-containing protein [Bryobacterales bacterium]